MDLTKLRDLAIQGGFGEEEPVTVDTRALIDKVLARYSSDFTTYRELIQNAADAKAKSVSIKLETAPSLTVPLPHDPDQSSTLLHIAQNHTILRVTISNDGLHFRPEDWSRLKNIAEGNPDETKIGAFGVGFYSVFADCEEPFVVSGHKALRFFWKGNRLFTQTIHIDSNEPSKPTTFILDSRDKSTPIPDLTEFCQFLSTCITFIHLESVELLLDSFRIFKVTKSISLENKVPIPSGVKSSTKDGLMRISEFTRRTGQIHSEWMNIVVMSHSKNRSANTIYEDISASAVLSLRSIFGKFTKSSAVKKHETERAATKKAASGHYNELSSSSVSFHLNTVVITTNITGTFARELERATKKPPCKTTIISTLLSPTREIESFDSQSVGLTSSFASRLFETVLPRENGKIYIGFPTSQTTGFQCHISAPSVIPTVERESIDLNARYISVWNADLLFMAGAVCRISYDFEMQKHQDNLLQLMAKEQSSKEVRLDLIEKIVPDVIQTFKQYTVYESTPSSTVGSIVEDGFWNSSKKLDINILTDKGIISSRKSRVGDSSISFIRNLPMVPAQVIEQAGPFLESVFSRGLLSAVLMSDIIEELSQRVLDEQDALKLLKWAAAEHEKGVSIKDVLSTAVLNLKIKNGSGTANQNDDNSVESEETIVALAKIQTFLPTAVTFSDLPLPDHTIPQQISRQLVRAQMIRFGWQELRIKTWLEFIISNAKNERITIFNDETVSTKVLNVLSRQWGSIGNSEREEVSCLLKNLPVMPTNMGLRKPCETYFPHATRGFDDLPVFLPCIARLKESFLKSLGVRSTLQPELLIKSILELDVNQPQKLVEIVKYLVTVSSTTPESELKKLSIAEMWPFERYLPNRAVESTRTKINQLYEPTEQNKLLGLPVLLWPSTANSVGHSNYREMKFLRDLGLNANPCKIDLVNTMLQAVGKNEMTIYEKCLAKFISLGIQKDDNVGLYANIAFLPAENISWPRLFRAHELFVNRDAHLFGYHLVRKDLIKYAQNLCISEDPALDTAFLHKLTVTMKPNSFDDAVAKFQYMAKRVNDHDAAIISKIQSIDFIPIFDQGLDKPARYTSPSLCVLGSSDNVLADVFDFVDFGGKANYFLSSIGVKHEPCVVDVARVLAQFPRKILHQAKPDGYLNQLRKLAAEEGKLRAIPSLWNQLKSSPFLLAYRDIYHSSSGCEDSGDGDLDDDEPLNRTWHLQTASNIVIPGDNIREFGKFRQHLFAAPQDDSIEKLYKSLGASLLKDKISKETRIGDPLRNQGSAFQLHKHICERTKVFLHDHEKSKILKDRTWVDKHLQVITVSSLVTHFRLLGQPYSFRECPSALESNKQSHSLIYVTEKVDMYDLALCLIRYLLKKPTQNDAIALEMILSSDLRRLKLKGYNVDRILRSREKELQNKIAEDSVATLAPVPPPAANKTPALIEKPPPPLPEKDALPIQGHETKHVMDASTPRVKDRMKMPGSMPGRYLDDSPDGNSGGNDNAIVNLPPITSNGVGNSSMTNKELEKTLSDAIRQSKPCDSGSVLTHPSAQVIAEMRPTYCDARPAQNLVRYGKIFPNIPLFLSRESEEKLKLELNAHWNNMNAFGQVLSKVGEALNLSQESFHVFWESATPAKTIAFNQDGAIFCNYKYWYINDMTYDNLSSWHYWFMTVCHEVAHNLVKEHDSNHGFFTESLAHRYLPNFLRVSRNAGVVNFF